MSSQPSGRLQGRVAIITGSSGGLGRAIALLFASEGAKCFCVDKYANPRNPINTTTGKADDWNNRLNNPTSPSDSTSTGITKDDTTTPTHTLLQRLHNNPETATFHAADLTSEPAVQSTIQTCLTTYSRIDILVNAHGISTESTHPTPLRCHDLPLSDFQLTQSINTTSVFLTCKHVLSTFLSQPPLYPGGRGWIVNIASIQGLIPYYATPGYCASKGAVVMLSKQIALDYAPEGVRCNVVCPGFLDTNMTRNLQADREGRLLRGVLGRQPLTTNVGSNADGQGESVSKGGLGNVDDVARMVLVMAGDDVRWMTGQSVVVDGGYMIS